MSTTQQMTGAGTGRGDAAAQRARQLGVGGGGLGGVDLAPAVDPLEGGVGDDGIDEGNDGTAVAAEDVGDSGRDEGVHEEVGAREGAAVGAGGNHDWAVGIVTGIFIDGSAAHRHRNSIAGMQTGMSVLMMCCAHGFLTFIFYNE